MKATFPAGRRRFLAGLLATGLVPARTWADAGLPAYLSAAARADGTYLLCGIDAQLTIPFQIALPARGHAAAAYPTRPEAVAFARRPGTFAIVIDCATGQQKAWLAAPAGRHFYGHGVFSADGRLLFTTENDFEAGRGRIGVWDADRGYARLDDWTSGGIGPHDIKRLAGSDILVVANGGIDTHPESGRTKLNIPVMRPNLTYLADGQVVDMAELSAELHKNSIRHLALDPDGRVAFGMQWQGDGDPDSLVGLHDRGSDIQLAQAPARHVRAMQGYVGSIAFSEDGRALAVTSPKGGTVQVFDAQTLHLTGTHDATDVGGVAAAGDGFILSDGRGRLQHLTDRKLAGPRTAPVMWDNHLIAI